LPSGKPNEIVEEKAEVAEEEQLLSQIMTLTKTKTLKNIQTIKHRRHNQDDKSFNYIDFEVTDERS